MQELNRLDRDAFVDVVGPIFEESPWIAERTYAERPFDNLEDLLEKLQQTVQSATREEQLGLINAHPDLLGRAAREGTLTQESTREQAGIGALSEGEIGRFKVYNEEYRRRFGFPFVICARENEKESILAAFAARIRNDRDEEIATALREISKIASLRLADAVTER